MRRSFSCSSIHVSMRDEKEEERSKQGQTNNKAKQHRTPKTVTFPKKNELPRVGFEPTTIYNVDMHNYVCVSFSNNRARRGRLGTKL